MRCALAVGSLLVLTCASATRTVRAAPPAAAAPARSASPAPQRQAPRPSPPAAADLVHQLCESRAGCHLVDRRAAGRDARGALEVVRLSMAPSQDEADLHCHPQPEEYWLVSHGDPRSAQLLVHLCNDGYGAAGLGEDDIHIAPDRRTPAATGRSARTTSPRPGAGIASRGR